MAIFTDVQWRIIKKLQQCICELSAGGDSPVVIDNALGNGTANLQGNGTNAAPLYATANLGLTPTLYTEDGTIPANRQVIVNGGLEFQNVTQLGTFDINFVGARFTLKTLGGDSILLSVGGIRIDMAPTVATFTGPVGLLALSTNATLSGGTADIQLQTAGTTKATVANNGRVGIGTTTPIGKLHVSTGVSAITSSGPNNGMLLTDNTNFCRFYMENTTATSGQRVFAFDNTGGKLSIGSYSDTANATVIASIVSFGYNGAVAFNGQTGTAGQVLTSAGAGGPPTWETAPAPVTPSLAQVVAVSSNLPINSSIFFKDIDGTTNVGIIRSSGTNSFQLTASAGKTIAIMPTSGEVRILDSAGSGGTSTLSLECKFAPLPAGSNTPIDSTMSWNQGMANLQAQISAPLMFTATASGDGTTTTFNIPHGITGYTPTAVVTTPKSAGAALVHYSTISGANVVITYTAPPIVGTNNLEWNIFIK